MAIPTLPAFFDMIYCNPNGTLAPDGYMYNDQMFQALNELVILINEMVTSVVNQDEVPSVVINGINPPSYTTAEIVALEPDVPVGTIWYNNTLQKLQFKASAGVIETITSV